jgi:transcriptional regulator with XRE-family HTH domain
MTLAAAVVDEVRRRLTARNMSQTGLARAAGIAPTLMHRTMNAERVFDLDELEAVAAALDVTPLYLLRQSLDNSPTRTGDTASD